MNKSIKIPAYLILLFALLNSACSSLTFRSEEKFLKWLNSEESGHSKTKTVNEFKLNAKLLPASYVAYRNGERYTAVYDSTITILLSIKNEGNEMQKDLLSYETYSKAEYKMKFTNLSYNMHNYVWLKVGDLKIKPVLATLENTYDLKASKTFYIVFNTPLNQGNANLDFVFNDVTFNTGINHFVFKHENIKNVPVIKFD